MLSPARALANTIDASVSGSIVPSLGPMFRVIWNCATNCAVWWSICPETLALTAICKATISRWSRIRRAFAATAAVSWLGCRIRGPPIPNSGGGGWTGASGLGS